MRSKTDSTQWTKLFLNFFLIQSWIPDSPYTFCFNGVSWSISTEMFFYMMFPLFLLGGQRLFWRKYTALLALTVVLIVTGTIISHTNLFANVNYMRLAHNNPLLRLPEFCTGMAIGHLYLNRAKVISALETPPKKRSFWLDSGLEITAIASMVGYKIAMKELGITYMISQASWGGIFPASFLSFSGGCFLCAAVVYLFSKSQGVISKFCSTPVMVFLGEVSFGFYMIHPFVIRVVRRHSEFYGDLSPIAIASCVGLIALAGSIVLYKVVEVPCKAGLLRMYDGNWTSGLSAMPTAAWKFSKSGLCALTLILIFVPAFTLQQNTTKPRRSRTINEIVANTDTQLRGVKFGGVVKLLGYEVVAEKSGWKIRMAWLKHSEFEHGRYLHICDSDGNIIGHGPREEDIFRNAKRGEHIVDTVFLKNQMLENGAASINIGLLCSRNRQVEGQQGHKKHKEPPP